MERFHGFVTLMQPKIKPPPIATKIYTRGFSGVLSPNMTLVFNQDPPPSGTRVLHGAVPRVRDPGATKGKTPPIATKIYTRGFSGVLSPNLTLVLT